MKEGVTAEKARERARAWHVANPERARELAARTYARNRAARIDKARAWAAANPERRKEIANESGRRRRRENPQAFREAKRLRRADPAIRLNDAVSAHMRICLKGRKAGASWEALVGYTLAELMAHLSARFDAGMSFENYGEWHIDHVRPMASFVFRSVEDAAFGECWALSNLQPLWAIENIRKNSQWNGIKVKRQRADS